MRSSFYTPFPCDCEAELFAVQVDQNEVKRQRFVG